MDVPKLKDDVKNYKNKLENLLGYLIDSSFKGDWEGFYDILIRILPSDHMWLNMSLLSAVIEKNVLAVKVLLTDSRGELKFAAYKVHRRSFYR